jgi:uncharacterized protein (DUF488 family)
MKLYTIGFSKKSAREFFTALCQVGVRCVLDVRHDQDRHAPSFARRDNLEFFLQSICRIDYLALPNLAPSPAMVHGYRTLGGDWKTFEQLYLSQLARQRVEAGLSREMMDNACLLCHEDKPHHCHRRLIAEYLEHSWGGVEIIHL